MTLVSRVNNPLPVNTNPVGLGIVSHHRAWCVHSLNGIPCAFSMGPAPYFVATREGSYAEVGEETHATLMLSGR